MPASGLMLYALCFLFYLGFDTYTAMFFPIVGLSFPRDGCQVLTMMSAGQSLGMLLVSFIAPTIYKIGFGLNIVVAVCCTIVCLVLFGIGYRHVHKAH